MKLTKIKTVLGLVAIMTIGLSFTTDKITVKGSDTMVILAQKWAEVYMSKHPETAIQVTGGGSGVGISALINGSTDIANSSRPIKPSEVEKIKARYGTLGVEIPCAKDGISIYLNKANGVSELTLKQIADIYTGKITNWNQVGGVDGKIKLYGRESSSGTYVYFKDYVIKKDYSPACQSLPGTAAIVNAVKKDKFGIGYGGAAYDSGVKDCKVKKDADSPAYLPTAETIKNKTYPITRYLYMYLGSRPTGATKKYIDWILSAEGQKICTQVGYFPLK
ncbi:phosphate ABC transporter substrate-binding protein [Flavobacterium sp.]|uniref:phosphate ABC transporter substrate-binding protein n=1 Tax=Flavobacterium sp. TaxID=239 RepID=UPI00260FDD43|nr:phosphate ABC transporter substrate-binding protein [Flavobacterium sp.]